MRHVLSALLLLLLLSVQQASGRAVLQPENGTGESYATHYWSEGASVQDDTGENWPLGYDLVSDVCDGPNLYAYVRQNPWSKFDPDGLSEVYLVGGVRREADPVNGHDNSAHHFYTAAARVAQQRAAALKKAGSSEKVSVIMYEPAYVKRATNDKKKDPSGAPDPRFHLKLMEKAAKKPGSEFDLIFVKDEKAMMTETARVTATDPMKKGGYFGHSNDDRFLIDYGEAPPATGTDDVATKSIGASDFKTAGVKFAPGAQFTSYGCHQGESGAMMEQLNVDQKIETTGSQGKTLYGPIGQGKSIPDSEKGYKTYPKPPPPKPIP